MIPAINVKTQISNRLRISGDTLQTHTDSTTNNIALSVPNKKYFGKTQTHYACQPPGSLLFWTAAAGLHYMHQLSVYRPNGTRRDLSETDLCNMKWKSSRLKRKRAKSRESSSVKKLDLLWILHQATWSYLLWETNEFQMFKSFTY